MASNPYALCQKHPRHAQKSKRLTGSINNPWSRDPVGFRRWIPTPWVNHQLGQVGSTLNITTPSIQSPSSPYWVSNACPARKLVLNSCVCHARLAVEYSMPDCPRPSPNFGCAFVLGTTSRLTSSPGYDASPQSVPGHSLDRRCNSRC